MQLTWTEIATKAIDKAVKECVDGDLKKAIDNAYPFGERAYHPYKIWLKVRKKKLIKIGLIQEQSKKKTKKQLDYEAMLELSNRKQQSLFEDTQCKN